MKKSVIAGFVALLINAYPAFATCTASQSTCFGTLDCTQLIVDSQFSDWNASSCPNWVGSGYTSYHVDNSSGDDYWEIWSLGGNVYQQFTVPSPSDAMEAYAVIDLVKTTAGTEKIIAELTNTSGTVLETLGTYYASTSGTRVVVNTTPTPLGGQTVRLRFRVVSGSAPGDTLFHVTQAYVRSYDLP
jgi:hypothetical protein